MRGRVLVWAGAVIAVAALVGLGVHLARVGLDEADKLASVIGSFVAMAGLAVAVYGLISGLELRRRSAESERSTARDVPAPLDQAVDELALAVRQQWGNEAAMRGLHQPSPLRVRWSSTGRPVAASPAAVLGEGVVGGRPVRLRLRGDVSEAAAMFLRLPKRQLVVLGEPGAGKTVLAILFTLDLIERRGPVPVLLPASSWNPQAEHLHGWIARRLAHDFPGLRSAGAYRSDTVARLIEDGRVLPVIDGLDEMPAALHTLALQAIDHAVAGRKAIVITCRTGEYETAIASAGRPLATAAVVELGTVGILTAAAFLTAGALPGDNRWSRVLDHVSGHPAAPLAQALSTPLMLSLARSAYAGPTADPAELLDERQFPDRGAVERHLLDAFVPAVYRHLPVPRPHPPGTTMRAYRAGQAHHWLVFLASFLQQRARRDLAWWRLHRALPPVGKRVAVGCCAGLFAGLLSGVVAGLRELLWFGLPGGLASGLRVGSFVALLSAVPAGLAAGVMAPPFEPIRLSARLSGRLGQLVVELRGFGWSGLLSGVVLGAWVMVLEQVLLGRPSGDLSHGFVVTALMLVIGLVLGFMQWLRLPADQIHAVGPQEVLRADRDAAVVLALGGGAGIGAATGLGFTYFGGDGFVVALWSCVVVGVPMGFVAAWPWYLLSAGWLALRGRLPWRVMAFLDDAHRRDVLRKSGTFYEFRHARLQDRLAGRPFLTDGGQGSEFAATARQHGSRRSWWRARLTARLLRGELFEWTTDRARVVIVLAQEEARAFKHDYIGSEHILLGLIQENDGIAARVLKGMGVSLEEVRCVIEEVIADRGAPGHPRVRAGHVKEDAAVERGEPVSFTSQTRKVLKLALCEALRLGHDHIGTEHLLLGLMREGESAASQVLLKSGIAVDRVRSQIDRELARHGAVTGQDTSPSG